MKIKIVIVVFVLLLCTTPMMVHAAEEESHVYDGYVYDYWGKAQESPSAFILSDVIDYHNMDGINLQSVEDVCTSEDGRILLVDTVESRVNVFDENGILLKSLKVIRNANDKIVTDEVTGEQLVLTNPEGVYVHEKQKEIYIADTGAFRIIVLDSEDYSYKKTITKPDAMSGVTEFKPSKITVDSADRIYVVVQAGYEGIIELNEDGSFSRYFGVNSPKVSLLDYFWKSLASDTQKSKMGKIYAPAFNNLVADSEGFVYATTFDNTAKKMVFRLNSSGGNVLREKGNTWVIGDINYMNGGSEFIDIAVTGYGTYAVLDAKKGRIFLYNFDGEMLNAFGSIGNLKGQFKDPTGIAWLGNKLVVTDSNLKCAYILSPTAFGATALEASEKYYFGKWDEALELFEEAIRLNANYEIAYVGIGKNYLMKDEFKAAMYYFKLGNNKEYYSKAYNGYRGIQIKNNFAIIAILFLIATVSLFYSEYRYHRKDR